jgi:hypothetical protein
MDHKTVVAAAGALVLTVVGAMSALAVALDNKGSSTDSTSVYPDATGSPIVVTEYVDEAGNPLSGPDAVTVPPQQTMIVPVQGQANDVVLVENADGTTSSLDSAAVDDSGSGTQPTTGGGVGGESQFAGDDQYEGENEGSAGGQGGANDRGDDESEGNDD